MKNQFLLSSLLVGVFLGGCATIIGDATQLLPIMSQPGEAAVLITDEKGTLVFNGKTPTTVTLDKSDGSYWGGKEYVVQITKDGYEDQSIPIRSHPNGWYLAGNLVFGGLIGWFIIDPLGGAMYTLSPEQVSASLGEKTTHNNRATDGSIAIVLLQDVPKSLRKEMKRVAQIQEKIRPDG